MNSYLRLKNSPNTRNIVKEKEKLMQLMIENGYTFDIYQNLIELESKEGSYFFPKVNSKYPYEIDGCIYGQCCFCGEMCNVFSQSCGACIRGSDHSKIWYTSIDEKIYYKINETDRFYTPYTINLL